MGDTLTTTLQQLPGEAARQVMATTPQGPRPSRWTLRSIRASVVALCDYTLSGVWRVLRRYKFKLRSAAVEQYSPDPDYAAKLANLMQCLREAAANNEQVRVLFLDEAGYHRWPEPARNWQPAAPVARQKAARAKSKQQQWRIVAALDALDGRVSYHSDYICGRKQLISFYAQLAAQYAGVGKVYIVQDNWSVHNHPDVVAALQKWPQLQIVWLPTYAPWLNPIEKLWRWLKQEIIKLHQQAGDWQGLRERVAQFLRQFAAGSEELLRYVGLRGDGQLAQALLSVPTLPNLVVKNH